MGKEIDLAIEFYTDKKKEGKSFSEIRKELGDSNYSQDAINYIIKSIDNKLIHDEIKKSNKTKVNEIKAIGYFLFIGGIASTILTYTGIINMKGYYILSYGPIIVGFFMIFTPKNLFREKQK